MQAAQRTSPLAGGEVTHDPGHDSTEQDPADVEAKM